MIPEKNDNKLRVPPESRTSHWTRIFGILLFGCLFAGGGFVTWKMQSPQKPLKARVVVPQNKEKQSQDLVLRTIRSRLNDVKDCYNQSLQHNQRNEGELKLSWFLDGSGEASAVSEITNETGDDSVSACAKAAVAKWPFPKGIVLEVKYTFHLKKEIRETIGKPHRATASSADKEHDF